MMQIYQYQAEKEKSTVLQLRREVLLLKKSFILNPKSITT